MAISDKTNIYDHSMFFVEKTYNNLKVLLASIIGYHSCYMYKGKEYSVHKKTISKYETLPESLFESMDHYINLEQQFRKDKAIISSYIRKLVNECMNLYEFHILIPQPCLEANESLSGFLDSASRRTPESEKYYTSFDTLAFKGQHKHVYEIADRWKAKYTMLGV